MEIIIITEKSIISAVLQGICKSNLMFTDVDCRWPDSVHDARIFRTSDIQDVPKMAHFRCTYGVEEITINVRKMLKKFYWTYLLIWRSLKVALNMTIISK
jgi:hypothetical protein